jgi:hypothetical protein
MTFRRALLCCLWLPLFLVSPSPASLPGDTRPVGDLRVLSGDPLASPDTILEGAVRERCRFVGTPPVFPGDAAGALRARYLSTEDSARVGWPLTGTLGEEEPFTAFFVLEIREEGFLADPLGFHQISWGLWNAERTGLQRVLLGPDADTFDLLEFDWFPNVNPFFGGPYLSPALFGSPAYDAPSFPDAGAFANADLFFGPPADLPRGEPLVTTLVNRPAEGVVVIQAWTLGQTGALLPVPGAQALLSAGDLYDPRFAFDAIGLTLYRDPFSTGEAPSVDVTVDVHALGVVPGLLSGDGLPELLRRGAR